MRDVETVKRLREKTGVGIMECKNALIEVNGDIDKAVELLRKRGFLKVHDVANRVAKEGRIESYVHMNAKIGVLIEVNCETDFVAKCDDFKRFTKDLAMQIAACNPLYIRKEDIPAEEAEKEKQIIKSQIKDQPKNVIDKVVEGKLQKYYEEVCLLNQPFIKDDKITVSDYLNSIVAKIKENIVIRRFIRYGLGEESERDVS